MPVLSHLEGFCTKLNLFQGDLLKNKSMKGIKNQVVKSLI